MSSYEVTGRVINGDTLRSLVSDVTKECAECVMRTYGPYGQNTLIQTFDGIYATKDGWTVLQNQELALNGKNSVIVNSIKKLITDVAQSVLLKAGDGTSTAVIVANFINTLLDAYFESHDKMNARVIENHMVEAVDLVVNQLYEKAKTINKDNMYDYIYHIALVSTNWDEGISKSIADIYKETNNTIIKIQDSGTDETYVEYINGYDLIGSLELPNYYINNRETGTHISKNPLILVFNHSLNGKLFKSLMAISSIATEQNVDLVVLAPAYDKDFLDSMISMNQALIRERKPLLNIIPGRYHAQFNVDKDCVEDFCMMIGAQLITKENSEITDTFNDLYENLMLKLPEQGDTSDEEWEPVKKEFYQTRKELLEKTFSFLRIVGGTCGQITLGEKSILVSDMTNKNEKAIAERKENLQREIDKKIKESNAKSLLTDHIRQKRIRLGKLECKMGVINVGGFGDAYLKAKRDSIDDATKACEAAYRDGIIYGGGISVINVTKDILNDESLELDPITKDFLVIIMGAYISTLSTMISNKYMENEDKILELGTKIIEEGKPYDLIKEDYSEDIIMPVTVEVEALKGSLRLVLINATSNQLLWKHYEDIGDVDKDIARQG